MGTVCSEMNGYTTSSLGPGTLVGYRSFALGQRCQINLPDPIARLAYKAVPKDASRRQRYNEAWLYMSTSVQQVFELPVLTLFLNLHLKLFLNGYLIGFFLICI